MEKIPVLDLSAQYLPIKEKIDRAVLEVLASGAFIMGPQVARFESEICEYFGVKHAVGVNSGTDALVIALRALGVGPGDEVITSGFSFFATAEAISSVGAAPVLVDIEPESFNLSSSAVERALTSRTKAIIPVHLFGRSAAMRDLMATAERARVAVVEDCAQSFGAVDPGLSSRLTGTIGACGALSFFPSKNLGGVGDGGMILTNDEGLASRFRALRTHGSLKKYFNEEIGYNSRLDTIQAAVLSVKLSQVDEWNRQRRQVAAWYHEFLGEGAGVRLPALADGHVFHQFTVRVSGGKRDFVKEALSKAGVESMVYYPVPIHQLPVYRGKYGSLPECERAAAEVLSLPMGPGMTRAVVERVSDALRKALRA